MYTKSRQRIANERVCMHKQFHLIRKRNSKGVRLTVRKPKQETNPLCCNNWENVTKETLTRWNIHSLSLTIIFAGKIKIIGEELPNAALPWRACDCFNSCKRGHVLIRSLLLWAATAYRYAQSVISYPIKRCISFISVFGLTGLTYCHGTTHAELAVTAVTLNYVTAAQKRLQGKEWEKKNLDMNIDSCISV